MVDLLACTVMAYPWGSRTAIASLTGRPTPSDGPEAELWMGAHPTAPSVVERAGGRSPLDAIVARAPHRELGPEVVRELGPRLPFLLKVLAAAEPLSLQAHPNAEQARAGWEEEERRQVPRSSATRNYKDASHKPELLCALTPFEALSGFRRVDETLRLFDLLAVPELEPALRPLRSAPGPRGLAESFRRVMELSGLERDRVVDATVAACRREAAGFAHERALAVRLAELHPGDVGVVSALFLELVHLAPGDAIYLEAGSLHAYVAGTGIEIMASSDNVLRGGLTKKHVDVPELLRVLDFAGSPARRVPPREIDEHEVVYDTPAREFRLSRVRVQGTLTREVEGPEILLATTGAVRASARAGARDVPLSQGCAAFVAAATQGYELSGEGTVFRATTNLSRRPP